MPSRISLPLALLFCFLIFSPKTGAQNGHGGQTRLLRTPTVSSTQIGFAYANNIWVVPRTGGSARRLTSFQRQTANPHFSPDGRWVAFSGS
jgi:tricorn protease